MFSYVYLSKWYIGCKIVHLRNFEAFSFKLKLRHSAGVRIGVKRLSRALKYHYVSEGVYCWGMGAGRGY